MRVTRFVVTYPSLSSQLQTTVEDLRCAESSDSEHPRQGTLQAGAAIWAPRDIPHVWANTATTNAKMILMCQPGGFENFFYELAKVEADKVALAEMDHLRPASIRSHA